MASAGRILIMPKGNYDESVTYEGLDLVYHNNTSWIAKKTTVGIEPNTTNSEYWHKLCESTDTAAIEQRLTALENKNVDMSGYALKSSLNSTNQDVSNLTQEVSNIRGVVTTNTGNITNLGTKTTTLEMSVSNLQNQVGAIGTSKENLNK